MIVSTAILLIIFFAWLEFEFENAPMYVESEDKFYYKDYITFLGIKVCKEFRKNKT